MLTNGSSRNEIGGTEFTDPATGPANNPTGDKGTVTPVFVVPPLGNQISGNTSNGVYIADGSESNMLNGNFIGTTANGDAALGNGANGVWITRATATRSSAASSSTTRSSTTTCSAATASTGCGSPTPPTPPCRATSSGPAPTTAPWSATSVTAS